MNPTDNDRFPADPARPHDDEHAQTSLRVLVLSGSSRTGSVNARLAALVAAQVGRAGGVAEAATLGDFPMSSYDGDAEADEGLPKAALDLCRRIEDAQALIIASPEYNASVPGALKNAIDWVSRYSPQPFKDKQTLLVSASPSMVGGNRGLWALRVPLEHLGARVYPDMFSLANAHHAFTEESALADRELDERLNATIGSFLDLVEADTRYLCLQRRWYEFLGDRTDAPVTSRAQD
ncbi:NADPH-dependent FMN reductase [Streptomyces sp. NPDC020858]|uniref:NADPH-dependent FMN reductase n=1 Tax=Streptomyces sp. NPDC020858 TaxID=3365097 RepID=UPI00378B2D9E